MRKFTIGFIFYCAGMTMAALALADGPGPDPAMTAALHAARVPDPTKTPGEGRTDITAEQICTIKWGNDVRAVTSTMKSTVYSDYGISKEFRHSASGQDLYEVDHFWPRELGGKDSKLNLWPQSYFGDCNAHNKERLENAMHKEFCAAPSDAKLQQLRQSISTDWIAEYEKRFGSCKH
jgi:hypothetical protein